MRTPLNKLVNPFVVNRRAFLADYCGGIGGLALAPLLPDEASASSGARKEPLAAVAPRRAARAKSVICLFQHGGPSQMDLFDAKPALNKYHGQPYPGGELEIHFDKQKGN